MFDDGFHDFKEMLDFSKSKEGKLNKIYAKYFQKISEINYIERTDDMEKQRRGIDTYVTLVSGEIIRVQEKWRTREFTDDFLIEYCSQYKYNSCWKKGWIYTIDADYLFVVYAPSDLVKIYPVVQLKIAWSNNKDEWIKKYNLRPAKNWGYVTLNVAVPCGELEQAITEVMKFEYQQKITFGYEL